jgi:hypothetical protein
MPNVSIDSSIKIFHEPTWEAEEPPTSSPPEYLLRREMAERAAAKRSSAPAARTAHQELAQLYAKRRHDGPA